MFGMVGRSASRVIMTTAQLKARGLAKHPGGRTSGKTPEICQKIVADVRAGQHLKAAAAGVGITHKTLNQWRDRDSKFASDLEMARLDGLKVQQQKARENRSIEAKLCKNNSTDLNRTTPRSSGGQPSKKTREAIAAALEVAKSGLPLRFIAAGAHVSVETLSRWREDDPEFNQRLESARLEGVKQKWDQILAAGRGPEGSWQAISWALERGFPAEFGRPEVQLAAVQSNFVQNNSLTITVEMAQNLASRASTARKKVDQLFASHRSQNSPDSLPQLPCREIEVDVP
jgi:transposase-like protein